MDEQFEKGEEKSLSLLEEKEKGEGEVWRRRITTWILMVISLSLTHTHNPSRSSLFFGS